MNGTSICRENLTEGPVTTCHEGDTLVIGMGADLPVTVTDRKGLWRFCVTPPVARTRRSSHRRSGGGSGWSEGSLAGDSHHWQKGWRLPCGRELR